MAKPVFYSVLDAPGGLFDVVVRMGPDRIVRKEGFLSLAEADEWIDGLRSLMAALGAPVAEDGINSKDERSRMGTTVVFTPAHAHPSSHADSYSHRYETVQLKKTED